MKIFEKQFKTYISGVLTQIGEDFDNIIVNYLLDEFKKESGIDIRDDAAAMQRIKDEAEKVRAAGGLYIIGTEPIERGVNIVGAHIDSPRIDIKQNPLYENSELAYADTHYYGGVKNINGWRSRWLYTE